MKTKGSITHIGVPLKELNRIYNEDAIIPVSKKALNAYLMAAGLDEGSKPISLKVTDNTEKKVEEKEKETVYVPMPTPEEQEMAPPLDINISDGDW
jgi:hypothetical protein|tara:strand:+ start:199 stop:486 length:288 start_codon:yes stop_codon:yes gene_type:complete